MGRGTRGVTGVDLRDGDEVVSMTAVAGGEGDATASTLLTVCVNGYGKRTDLSEFRGQRRGGKGIIAIKTSDRNGKVVGSLFVSDEDELMLVTSGGIIIRIPVSGVSVMGRATQGVRLIKVGENETVASVEGLHAEEMGREEGAVVATPTCDGETGSESDGDSDGESDGAEAAVSEPGAARGRGKGRKAAAATPAEDDEDSGWEKAIAGQGDDDEEE